MGEPGDPGVHPGSPTPSYTVSCLFVHDGHWVQLFEDMLLFRRYLRDNFGVRMREEVKANQLVKGSGPCEEVVSAIQEEDARSRWAGSAASEGRRGRRCRPRVAVRAGQRTSYL